MSIFHIVNFKYILLLIIVSCFVFIIQQKNMNLHIWNTKNVYKLNITLKEVLIVS